MAAHGVQILIHFKYAVPTIFIHQSYITAAAIYELLDYFQPLPNIKAANENCLSGFGIFYKELLQFCFTISTNQKNAI